MFATFLDSFWGMIQKYIDILKDSDIATYMFGGVSLWLILISLFCALILLRFFLNPVSGSGFFSVLGSSERQELANDRREYIRSGISAHKASQAYYESKRR